MAISEEIKEECGVVAAISNDKSPVAQRIYRGMIGVQHRGQDAAGLALYSNGTFYVKKGLGLVADIVNAEDLGQQGWIGIAHTRYPTTATATINDVQPTLTTGLAVAHNGHIVNYAQLRKELEEKGFVFRGTVDSEVIAYLLEEKLLAGSGILEAAKYAMENLDGAYSVVGIFDGKLFAFRDPHAIRPLTYGKGENCFMFCSESVGLSLNNITYGGSVGPGELWVVGPEGDAQRHMIMDKGARHCMFEYVYFSRPDSVIDDKLVEDVRIRLGEQLAIEAPVEADLVIPIPDTSRSAALGFAKKTGIEYAEGIIKNRYVGRTFIMPDQESRKKAVRLKLNPIRRIIEGKRIVLFDDSIVRGTTMKEIIKLVRACNPREIHLRITCPPVISPCFYGVDMPTHRELIANNMSIEEIREYLGVDSLHYISVGGLRKVVGEKSCRACVTGEYVTPAAQKMAEERKTAGSADKLYKR